MGAILAVDAGTTGTTCLVLDGELRVRGRAYQEIGQSYPRPGWVEHDPAEIAASVRATARQALGDAGVAADRLAGVGVAVQRETTVLWDRRTGRPVHPAIVWQDRRTAQMCRELRPEWQETVRDRTGLELDPYFSATKLRWLLDHVPDARRDAEAGRLAFGTIDAWLAWDLTGGAVHATDETNASRTLLWDVHRGAWDEELLELFGVPDAVLPEVVGSSSVVGRTTRNALGAEVPVASLVGDQQAALFGQRCFDAGQAKNTYGTGCFLLQHTGTEAVRSDHGLLATRAASPDGRPRYALEGSVFVGGAVVQWLRDGLKIVESAPEVDRLAEEVPDSAGVVVVPAFTGLGAPHWDPEARGTVLGLTRGSDRRHLCRAALDAIAHQCCDLVEAMEQDTGAPVPELRVDGGAVRSAILMQIQADLLQRPVVRPAVAETTAVGAGMLAGLAVDAWDLEALRGSGGGTETVFRPGADRRAVGAMRAKWHAAVAAARAFRPQP